MAALDNNSPYNDIRNGYYGQVGAANNGVLIENVQRNCLPSLEYKILVGYLGTIEMPGKIAGPRLQVVRQCIKKMRQEKRQPVAVLMTILPQCLTLRNANNQVLATYAANRMSYVSNGSQSETERCQTNFGLITTAHYDVNGIMVSPSADSVNTDTVVSNSCHVFMVNQKIVEHRVHFDKLSLFKIRCTRDPISNLCLEFPKDTDYVVNLIRSMYTLNTNEEQLMRVARSRAAAAIDDRNEAAALSNSPQPSNHSELTTTSSNSDSGIGFHNDCTNICDRILVVDFPGLRMPANGQHERWPNLNNGNGRMAQIPIPENRNSLIVGEAVAAAAAALGNDDGVDSELKSGSNLALEENVAENKSTVRAMPFPKKIPETTVTAAAATTTSTNTMPSVGKFEERAVDVPPPPLPQPSIDHDPLSHAIGHDEFVFRAPALPGQMVSVPGKSAKQRLHFFASKLSPKVFRGQQRPISQSCENICANGDECVGGARRQLSEQMDKCVEDEYIDIWGSVSEVNEQDCQRLYSEIDAQVQRAQLLDGAISEPNLSAAMVSGQFLLHL